ncbi:uncharacterized protein LOC130719345 [Lotus japonicus]|uniref:uncharacterized protein LOC130719345 n=1 Tax=Lotus japonicus TaxID=34305 RepID=UPI00258CB6AD|nr:uncharacterized protein LOC130719345 [Lotus japonicus]
MRQEDENNMDKPFGGKVVVLGGDIRQILPVIPKGGRQDIVSATINSSDLWKHCKVLKLTRNMRLSTAGSPELATEIKEFADWILKIGDGDFESNERGESDIEIPEDLLIQNSENPLLDLVDFAYPNLVHNMKTEFFLEERCILCPTLECVEKVNYFMLDLLPGNTTEYLSSDNTCKSDEDTKLQSEWFTTEFLNDITSSGIPNHKITLKEGAPIMLLRNIDQAAGLCNGTRLIVADLETNVTKAIVVTGTNIGEDTFISRMDMVPSDSGEYKLTAGLNYTKVMFNPDIPQAVSYRGRLFECDAVHTQVMNVVIERLNATEEDEFLTLFASTRIKNLITCRSAFKDPRMSLNATFIPVFPSTSPRVNCWTLNRAMSTILVIHMTKDKGSSREDSFDYVWTFIIWGPFTSVILLNEQNLLKD